MAMLQGGHGHGTLGYDGKIYKFKATGLGYGGLGVKKVFYEFISLNIIGRSEAFSEHRFQVGSRFFTTDT
jgi:hypothetical protein